MTLNLDHNQRLNLIAMLDGLECQGRREAFAVCRLQEKLELTDEERAAIGWQKMKTPGPDGREREYTLWQNNGAIRAREFELPEDDVTRICNAVDKYPVVLGRDKHWWLPLTLQLPKPAETNGDKLS